VPLRIWAVPDTTISAPTPRCIDAGVGVKWAKPTQKKAPRSKRNVA
jgi:hypothetical protein